MAIDSRIALGLQPLNIGQRMAQNVQNLQQMDLLNQQRQKAPFQNRLLELKTQLSEAQTPAQIAAIEQAQSPLQQASDQLSLEQKVGLQTFQRIQPMLDSGNTIGAIAELTSIKEQFPDLSNAIEEDILALQTQPEVFKQEVNAVLQQAGIGQSTPQISTSQRERQAAIDTLKSDPNQQTVEGQEAAIFLGLKPKAGTITGQERIAQDQGVTQDVAQSQAAIESARRQATEDVTTKETGKRKAVSIAVDFANKANSQLAEIPKLTTTYKDAIEQLDKGAETGIVYSMLPSFDVNAMILDNISSEAGFNLAKSGGGIITEADMDWGMRTAIPQNLPPQELKQFLQRKIEAQEKIADNLLEAVSFLGDGTKTLPDWYKFKNKQAKITEMTDEQLLSDF